MNEKHYQIKRTLGGHIHVCVKHPKKLLFHAKTIIFVHGFLGEGIENHRMFIRIAEKLNEEGFTCILFDQYGCGYSDGDYKDVLLKDLKMDLEDVTIWAKKTFGEIIGYLGQSVGSALILSMEKVLKPKFQICINPAAGFNRWLLQRYNWDLSKEQEYFYAYPKGILVSRCFLLDLINWDWIKDISIVSNVPTLLVVSGDDEINSVENAMIVKKMKQNTEIVSIPKANHSFICQRELEKLATEYIANWLNKIYM